MFVFEISDRGKKIKFDGRFYRTPCMINVHAKQIKPLKKLLKENGITNVQSYRKYHKKNKSQMVKTPIIKTGTIVLSTKVGGH